MNATQMAIATRTAFVQEMEAHNKQNEIPVYWRIRDGKAEIGYEVTQWIIDWQRIDFLSTYLLNQKRKLKALDEDFPY